MGKTAKPDLQHLVDMTSLDASTLFYLFKKAGDFLEAVNHEKVSENLKGKVITNLFFESSTRTRMAFTIAAKRMGAFVINPDMRSLATVKGETLLDTIHTFTALGTALFVIRHADNNTAAFVASELTPNVAIINAGDGDNQHPTQALLDLFTIHQHKPDFPKLKVAIIGDILHSRVARSLVDGLNVVGADAIRLIAPDPLIPDDITSPKVSVTASMKDGLEDVDVVMALRIQKERMQATAIPDPDQFYKEYGLTPTTLAYAKPDAIVMHPGPINRGVEIDSCVADGPQSVILEQVRNGVAMRMALMDCLLS